MTTPRTKIALLIKELSAGLYEKEQTLTLCLLASIAGENVFLFGPPGTAKSLVCRRLKYAFESAVSFEYLLNQFSTPDEVFGPVSIQKLKDEGKYERLTEGYFPRADIVFLDEIWKAGSAIANALLTAINEKIFRNGVTVNAIPLKLLVSASNELPGKEAGLEALWDRFLLRLPVGNIQDTALFKEMINAPEETYDAIAVTGKITAAEFAAWTEEAGRIRLNDYTLDFMVALKENIAARNETAKQRGEARMYISDRRWRKAARLIKTAAYLNGRAESALSDCLLLKYCLWSRKEEIDEVDALLEKTMREDAVVQSSSLQNIRQELYALKNAIVQAVTSFVDERRTVLCEKSSYYFFQDAAAQEKRFISRYDYSALEGTEKQVMLYKRIPVKTGYLGHGRYKLFKSGQQTFNMAGDDIELFLVPEKRAHVKKEDAAYTIYVDGTAVNLETAVTGNKYRITRAPSASELGAWQTKTEAAALFTDMLAERLRCYERGFGRDDRQNLFTDAAARAIDFHTASVTSALEKIKLEILELRDYYQSIKDEKTVIL